MLDIDFDHFCFVLCCSGTAEGDKPTMSDRVLNLFNLGMGRFPAVDVDVHMTSLFEACRYFYEKGDAFSVLKAIDGTDEKKEANAIYVSDLEEDDATFSLLLVRGDPGRPLPSFVNPARRKVIPIHAPDAGAVPGTSSHLVIQKKATTQGTHKGRHRAAMQRARGISRALSRDFLTQLMARYSDEFPDQFVAEKKRRKKGRPVEQVVYRPTVSFHPQENGSLKNDLKDGRIAGFKLRRGNTTFEGEASEAKIQHLDVQLSARIVPTRDFGPVKALIDHVRQSFDNVDFEALNIELVDEEGEPLDTTRQIDVDRLGENDLRYVRTIPIPGDDEMSDCYPKFHPPILAAAKVAIATQKHWA